MEMPWNVMEFDSRAQKSMNPAKPTLEMPTLYACIDRLRMDHGNTSILLRNI